MFTHLVHHKLVRLFAPLVMVIVLLVSNTWQAAGAGEPARWRATATPKPTVTATRTPTPRPTATSTSLAAATATKTPLPSATPTVTVVLAATATPVLPPSSPCVTTTASTGAYSVTLCFNAPAGDSTVSGDLAVTVTASSTGTFPGIQRIVFYLNGQYLITDYHSPYTFTLPTMRWQDGVYPLQVEALLRDATVTQRSSVNLTFANGIITPPVNNRQFVPSSGSAPAPGQPFLVAAAGDGASGELAANNVTNLLGSIQPNLFLYLGDVYEKGSPVEFYNWYGVQGINFGQVRSITNPTIGNHEYEKGAAPGYFDYWDNIPNYYSFDAGGWHFISLNSNTAFTPLGPTSAQYQWLQQDLATHANTCTIVYYHHPLFNIGPEGSTTSLTDAWALMAQYGVDIVLNGHDHTYQRWTPLDGSGQPSPSGITEFVAGASGHGLQTIATSDSRVAYSIDTNPDAFGILKLELNANGAAFNYVNTTGASLDSGVIPCNNFSMDTQAPSTPGSLFATASSATRVDLSWTRAYDNTGVQGYSIYRDGSLLATVSGVTLGYADTTAQPSTTYNYSVDAFDAAGNHSAAAGPATITTPAIPSSLTFNVQADTYVNASLPASNYGSATALRTLSSPDLHAYLRFTVQGLAGYPINRARLMVYANTNGPAGINALAVADNAWLEKGMTYNNAPVLGPQIASSGAFSSGSWVALDVTAYVTGEGTYSFGLTTASTSTLSFNSREAGTNTPVLVIEPKIDSQPPSAPTGLTAAAVSATQVDLNWQAASDASGIMAYTIYRDGTALASVSGSTLTYSDTTVQPQTSYTYTVDALDPYNNPSAQSNPAQVTTPGQPASLTFTSAADTYVNATYPNNNYGSATVMRLLASPEQRGYLRFNVQGLLGTPVVRARLLVYANTNAAGGINALAVADNSWGEKTINYSNAPTPGATLVSSGPITAGGWVTLDVTGYVTGDGLYSFALTTPSLSTLSFNTKEAGANAPQLIVDLQ